MAEATSSFTCLRRRSVEARVCSSLLSLLLYISFSDWLACSRSRWSSFWCLSSFMSDLSAFWLDVRLLISAVQACQWCKRSVNKSITRSVEKEPCFQDPIRCFATKTADSKRAVNFLFFSCTPRCQKLPLQQPRHSRCVRQQSAGPTTPGLRLGSSHCTSQQRTAPWLEFWQDITRVGQNLTPTSRPSNMGHTREIPESCAGVLARNMLRWKQCSSAVTVKS